LLLWLESLPAGYTAFMPERRAPRLETSRLILSLPTEADAESLLLYAFHNREHLRPWSPPEPPGALTIEGAQKRAQRIQQDFQAGRSVAFWFREKGNEEAGWLGAANLSNIVWGAFRACYLGYHLDVDHVGKGFMTEALEAVIRYAFDELELHRIMANFIPSNERSANVLKRLGFAVEGYARDYLFIGGAFRDHVLTALTNTALRDPERLCIRGSW
jgi:[ribosomal protein S5]-alanine N-acetyltransferase